MESVSTPGAPAPLGHYAQAVAHAGLVYVSGQLAIDPQTGESRTGSIEEETEQVLRNVAAILEAAGSGIDRVVKTTVYISDISLWGRMDDAYGRFFGEHRPARAAVPVRDLPRGFRIEIEAVAAVPGEDRTQ